MPVQTANLVEGDLWSKSEVEAPEARQSRLHAAALEATGGVAMADHPLITKNDILEAQQSEPPFGSMLACPQGEVVRMYVGAGPEATFFTAADIQRVADHGAWAFWTNGFRGSDIVDVTINYHWVIAGTMMDESFRRIGCAVVPGGVGGATTHLENIRWCGVTGLFAFPTFLDELTQRAEETGVDVSSLGVRRAVIAGEMQTPGRRALIEERWNLQVREMYGGAEVPFVAAECDAGGGMHLNPELIVEVLDPETWQPVPQGTAGVVVVSDPFRQAMPILRYVTGDITAGLDDTLCACGRTTPRLGRIIGRVGGIPRVKGLLVVPAQVQRALDSVEGLGRWQLIIDRPGTQDTLEVVIEDAGPEGQRDDRARQTVERLREAVRVTATVTLVQPGSIPTDAETIVDRRSTISDSSPKPQDGGGHDRG